MEERRYYSNTYLEICEVYDEAVEVSVFSAVDNPYEIYLSYGIIYCDKEEAYEKFEEIKQVLQKDYEENQEPSGEFINMFADTYMDYAYRMMYFLICHRCLNYFREMSKRRIIECW